MRIYCPDTKNTHTLEIKTSAVEHKSVCPECSHTRKKSKDKCMSFNTQKGYGYCNHCERRYVKHEEKQEHKPIEWKNYTGLTDKMVEYFTNSRLIGQQALKKMGVCQKEVFMPQLKTKVNAISFPYTKDGAVVNVKYRDNRKNFRLEQGAELIWYNYDAIKENKELIIVEGEMDALSFMTDGMYNVISVPNGANARNMAYLDSSIKQLEHVETFIICTDNDTKGIELKDELIRRLGAERCKTCNLRQFKDANEYLLYNGHKSLLELKETAKQVTVEGIIHALDDEPALDDYFSNGFQGGKTLGSSLDDKVTWETKRLLTITGTPSSGKSEFIDWMNVRLNIKHGWKVAYFSPENFPTQYHIGKIVSKMVGKPFNEQHINHNDYTKAKKYVDDNFFWVWPEDNYTLENILAKFKYLVKSKGVKVVCLDPFNKIEYRNNKGYSKLDFISSALDEMIKFAKVNDVLFQLVAHPKKLQKTQDGLYPMATMYDISGSSDFWNKTDYGLSIIREQDPETLKFQNNGTLGILKVKFRHLGEMGEWAYTNNYKCGRYEDGNIYDYKEFDDSNWIDVEEYPDWATE